MPLPRHQDLHVFLYDRSGPELVARFPENRVFVHFRLTKPLSPPRGRWYALELQQVSRDRAVVAVDDAETLDRVLELRKRDGRWIIVLDEIPLT